ncbi:MAG TPA: beta-ketoacyl synthase N-terminal-like domain-containing protein [Polyangiaceae bacterium]|nr:beta-ketoacyl synthase N-terminal-like domain-containing protein [Polyangiaceae bacterium]
MRAASVVAAAALSALGRGHAAYGVGEVGELPPAGLALHTELDWVRHPLFGRVPAEALASSAADGAERLLCSAALDLAAQLDQRCPGWRSLRLGVVLGTSAGAMQTLERALAGRAASALSSADARAANYFSPISPCLATLGVDRAQATVVQILAACASSTIAIGLGCRWLDADDCDLVIAGGYDALSALVAAGFDSLSALTRARPRPFRVGRDGMALGEGAGLVALRRAAADDGALGRVLGFGASSDAFHVTAPDREGRGLVLAARAALADAALPSEAVAWVSAHATATPYNDAAEARALSSLFGARPLTVHPWKAAIGHTLGAAGVLESLAVWDALARGVLPAAAGEGEQEPGSSLSLAPRNGAQSASVALKVSAAFGGCNAALLLGAGAASDVGVARPRQPVFVQTVAEPVTRADPELVARLATGEHAAAASRADSLSELALAAVARLLVGWGQTLSEATAVVVGTSAATLELDERFDRRRRAREPVEPRRFPATSPNLCASLCSICFGLRGPAFSVGASLSVAREALLVAHDLVAAGDAPAALVLVAEDAGEVVADLFGVAGFPIPARGARAALLGTGPGFLLPRAALTGDERLPLRDLGPLSGWPFG